MRYTFGVWPLQQLLVPGDRGRLHSPLVSWDSRDAATGGQRWFRLRPEDGRVPPSDLFHSFGPYQRWNSMCAECHSTGIRKNYDPVRDRYETTWTEDGVGCEACHGAGAAHVAYERGKGASPALAPPRFGLPVTLKEKRPLSWKLDPVRGIWMREPVGRPAEHTDTCARCHSRRGTIAEEDPGASIHDTHRLALLEEGLYFPDGQLRDEVFEHGSYLQSKMFAIGVGCFDCHEHGSRARTGGAASACANCHLREKFATPAHHFHVEGKPGSACVDCHMPTRTYMVVHARRDHAIRIPRPDLTLTLGTPNACNQCHADQDARWATDKVRAWWGAGVANRPHYGTALAAGRSGAPGATAALAALIADPKIPAIVRGTAALLLGRNLGPGAAQALATAVADPDPLVRRGVVEASVALPPAERWGLVGPLLTDPARVVRIDAARHLAGTSVPTPEDARRLAAALTEARAAAALAADTPEGGMGLGNLALAEGDLVAAERAFRAVLRDAPGFVPAYVNLADVMRMQGREPEALRTLQAGLAAVPDGATLHHALALALVRAKRLPEAATHLERAVALAPDDAPSAVAWALYLSDTGDGRRALAVLEAALARRPYDIELLMNLTQLRMSAGDRPGTIEALHRLEALLPWEPRFRAERERLEKEKGR